MTLVLFKKNWHHDKIIKSFAIQFLSINLVIGGIDKRKVIIIFTISQWLPFPSWQSSHQFPQPTLPPWHLPAVPLWCPYPPSTLPIPYLKFPFRAVLCSYVSICLRFYKVSLLFAIPYRLQYHPRSLRNPDFPFHLSFSFSFRDPRFIQSSPPRPPIF